MMPLRRLDCFQSNPILTRAFFTVSTKASGMFGMMRFRLTVWQNLIIPNIPDAFVETVKKALVKMGFDWKQSNLRSGIIACTGNSYCKFASSNTKGHALELADHLDKKFQLDQPIN